MAITSDAIKPLISLLNLNHLRIQFDFYEYSEAAKTDGQLQSWVVRGKNG